MELASVWLKLWLGTGMSSYHIEEDAQKQPDFSLAMAQADA